ncbi:hypothetical protein [Azospirillum argentinense]
MHIHLNGVLDSANVAFLFLKACLEPLKPTKAGQFRPFIGA